MNGALKKPLQGFVAIKMLGGDAFFSEVYSSLAELREWVGHMDWSAIIDLSKVPTEALLPLNPDAE